EPMLADEGEHDVAAVECALDRFEEIEPGLDLVDVDEDLVLGEALDERVVEAPGMTRGVLAPVVEEDAQQSSALRGWIAGLERFGSAHADRPRDFSPQSGRSRLLVRLPTPLLLP